MTQQKVVLVGGGASGLGAAVADAVVAHGWQPVVLDVRDGGHETLRADVTDRTAVATAVDDVATRHGRVDALVACAGIDRPGAFLDVPAEEWEGVIAVNLLGTANLVRAALPHLRSANGHLITVASTLGLRALPDATAYCASKFAVVGFTRALTLELKGTIGVTLLIPGGMATPFFDGRSEQYRPPADAKLNDPRDVAAAVMTALSQPRGCEIREMIVTPSEETSWP
jgi:NAD(P)-dependent dehydrogenase (short-subunit alcohol dehydrogenase family)